MDELQVIIDLVPESRWPTIAHWLAYGLVALVFVNGLLWLLDREDMRDGKRDLAWVPAWRAGFSGLPRRNGVV